MYYLPSLAEGPNMVAEDAWVLANVLFAPCYIAGWTAAQHWGLTEQLFRETFVATAASIRARRQTVLGTEFRLARLGRPRVESVTAIWRGSTKMRVSSSERTLVDGLVDPGWVGGVRHLAEMLLAYRELPGGTEERLALALRASGNGAAHKRAGYLLERLWPEARRLRDLAVERRTTGVIRLDPAVRSRGRMSRRWGLWVNIAVPASGAAP
jgi:predicted transcriptional regulator of viral defense system